MLIALCAALLIPAFAGYSLVSYLVFPRRWPVQFVLAISVIIGLGMVPQIILALDTCGLDWNLTSIYTCLGVIACIFLTLKFIAKNKYLSVSDAQQRGGTAKRLYGDHDDMTRYHHFAFYFLFIYVLFHLYIIFWKSMNLPLFAWDSIATCVFKSKIFYYEHDLGLLQHVPRASYPLQIPLLSTWISMNLHEWNDQLYKILFPLYFTSFLVIEYYFLRCFTNKAWSMLGVALVLSSDFCVLHASTSYRDITMMSHNCAAMFLLILWFSKRRDCLLILAGLISGFGTFTKLEGNGHLLIHVMLVIIMLLLAKNQWRMKFVQFVKFLIPAVIPVGFYLYYKSSHGVIAAERTGFDFQLQDIGRIPLIVKAFIKYTVLKGQWNVLWPVFILSLLNLFHKKHGAQTYFVIASMVMCFGLIFGVLLFTENYDLVIGMYEEVNLTRLFLHFFPLVTVGIILLNFSGREMERP